MKVEYSTNNSGGSWWLSDEDWKALEAAGWYVKWGGLYFCHSKNYSFTNAGPNICETKDECHGHRCYDSADEVKERWLGALAKEATKEFSNIRDALKEFETITNQSVTDEGCNCCGAPHSFFWTSDSGGWEYCSGEECMQYMFNDAPSSFRDAVEKLSNKD